MIQFSRSKTLPILLGTASSSATANYSADVGGAPYAVVRLNLPAATSGGTSTVTAYKIMYGDSTSALSALATGGTDFTLPTSNNTSTPHVLRIGVDNRKGYKYIGVQIQAIANYTTVAIDVDAWHQPESPTQDNADDYFTA